jgi:acetolactate decarboxylase
LQHGDFGFGTFEGLDGEMMILDGEIYQDAGTARRRTDDFLVLFAAITHFHEKKLQFGNRNVTSRVSV